MVRMGRRSAQKASLFDRYGNRVLGTQFFIVVACDSRAGMGKVLISQVRRFPNFCRLITDALISPATTVLSLSKDISYKWREDDDADSLFPDIDPAMTLRSLLLLSCLTYHVTSALINPQPTTLNQIRPQCYTPAVDPAISDPDLKDCRDTLVRIASTPNFRTPKRYSKNHRSGLPLPRIWNSGSCLIFVSCENDSDSFTFSFADVLVVAKKIVDDCVGTNEDPKWGRLRWGGIDELRDSESFYVSVSSVNAVRPPTGLVAPVRLMNETLIDPVADVSRTV